MDKEEITRRLKKIAKHAIHTVGEPPLILSLDDGIALDEAVRLLEEQESVPATQREVMNLLVWCCGSCGVAITEGDKFCRMCGKRVKWNECVR